MITILSIVALSNVLLIAVVVSQRRDIEVLRSRLAQLTQAFELFDVRVCRECRCTDDVACMTGCWWVEDDLCSSCADDLAASGSSLEDGKR